MLMSRPTQPFDLLQFRNDAVRKTQTVDCSGRTSNSF